MCSSDLLEIASRTMINVRSLYDAFSTSVTPSPSPPATSPHSRPHRRPRHRAWPRQRPRPHSRLHPPEPEHASPPPAPRGALGSATREADKAWWMQTGTSTCPAIPLGRNQPSHTNYASIAIHGWAMASKIADGRKNRVRSFSYRREVSLNRV